MELSTVLMTTLNVAVSETSEASGSLLDFTPTFVIVAINMLVLYFILKKLLFDKVTAFMEKRTVLIQGALDESTQAKEFAESTKKEYAEKMRLAQGEINKMLEDAKLNATKEYEQILRTAKLESDNLINKAKIDIEKEKDKMMKEIKNEVASLALSAASKVIEANLDNDANRKLVEKFIDEAGVA